MKKLLAALVFLALSAPAFAISPSTEQISCTSAAAVAIGSPTAREYLIVRNHDAAANICVGYLSTLTCSGGTNTDGIVVPFGTDYKFDKKISNTPVASKQIYCRGIGSDVTVSYEQGSN